MSADYIKCYGELQQELDQAKHTLVALNENIRRIVGRPKDLRNEKHKVNYDVKRIPFDNDRQGPKETDLSRNKRRSNNGKSVFNRLSAATSRTGEDESRPRLTSRVIRELPTRQEIVEAQGTDSESRARNRRMFGSLLGTLHKFCQEESRLKQKEEKKAQIEKKLEEQELQERLTLKRERESLFLDRKKKQLEIRKLELKMNRLKDFEMWQSSVVHLKRQIRTKTKPHIYFRPRVMSKKTEKLLSESSSFVDNMIEKKRESLNKELAEIENNLKIQEYDNDEQAEPVVHEDEFMAEVASTRIKDEPMDEPERLKDNGDMNNGSISKKDESDSKENNTKSSSEPSLSSSVVVVKSSQNDLNK